MARVPLLDGHEQYETSIKKEPKGTGWSLSNWAGRVVAQITGQDELDTVIRKTTTTAAGKPKEKHLQQLLVMADSNPELIEQILLHFSAVTNWNDSKVVSCKVLICMHNLLQKIDRFYNKYQVCVVFLDEVKDFWSKKDNFLEGYTIALLHKVIMDVENPALSQAVYDLGISFATGTLALKGYGNSELLLFTTNLMSYAERITALAQSAINGDLVGRNRTEKQTYFVAASYMVIECQQLLVIMNTVLEYLTTTAGHLEEYFRGVNALRDQHAEIQKVIKQLSSRIEY